MCESQQCVCVCVCVYACYMCFLPEPVVTDNPLKFTSKVNDSEVRHTATMEFESVQCFVFSVVIESWTVIEDTVHVCMFVCVF